jgi:mannose-6-phosphate isomerase-like protein (cupin superfamily)
MQVTVHKALESLRTAKGQLFTTVLKHGTMYVEIYRPDKVDLQTPHKRDELYVIISGAGEFINDGIRTSFNAGDVLFVPAGIEHRFENFTGDFLTWVIFYGPDGGEK